MNRRHFLYQASALAFAKDLVSASGKNASRIGLCTFSCHQHWKAVESGQEKVKYTDTSGFYRYSRDLGSEGVQTSLRGTPVKEFRKLMEETGGYYEGDLRLPKSKSDLNGFEAEVTRTREAGATVARAVLTGGRRYEIFKTLEDFQAFQKQAVLSLALAEPILCRHQLKLALENHKDQTTTELVDLITSISSEWIGVLVDTGNNIALLEEPHSVVESLAPYALSVHLKDMAVAATDDGFHLSEVPLGTGALDLSRIINVLARANPSLVFNLEMATRDPLLVPCLREDYFATFPGQKAERLGKMMQWIKENPPRRDCPRISNKPLSLVIAEEEENNLHSLQWMRENIHA